MHIFKSSFSCKFTANSERTLEGQSVMEKERRKGDPGQRLRPPPRASPHALLRKSAGDLGSQAGASYLFHKHPEVPRHPRPFCCYSRLLKKKKFKSLLTLLQYRFCFMFFGPQACGILAPQPGIKPAPPALKAKC